MKKFLIICSIFALLVFGGVCFYTYENNITLNDIFQSTPEPKQVSEFDINMCLLYVDQAKLLENYVDRNDPTFAVRSAILTKHLNDCTKLIKGANRINFGSN